MRRKWSLSFLVFSALAGVLLTLVPAQAATAMPRILLKGGAAQVSRTYTATPTSAYPSGSSARYQWYRGDQRATKESFVPIGGATGRSYTLRDSDHRHTVKVVVKAVRSGSVVGEQSSAPSNWIMYNMAPPVLSGTGLVGDRITATLGIWATEWDTSLWWRRTGIPIPGETGLTYTPRPVDAGKEISLLAIGEYEFPNGVHPIDRYAARMRIKWGTTAILRATSPAAGKLTLTTIPYAQGSTQAAVRGHVVIYDGTKIVKRFYLTGGRRTFTLSGLRSGARQMKMVYKSTYMYTGSRVERTFTVR